jgi:hypothetical protein
LPPASGGKTKLLSRRVSGRSAGNRLTACPGARQALIHYIGVTNEWRAKLGTKLVHLEKRRRTCARVSYLTHIYQLRAWEARKQWIYEYDWQKWLPAKWYRVAHCETQVNWSHDSGTYVSAFGIYRPAYADDAAHIGLPSWDAPGHRTPREQYLTALSHYNLHGGFSGWGCRGA